MTPHLRRALADWTGRGRPPPVGAAPTRRSRQRSPPRYGTATSAVVVDVVARDKKGPVIDLTQADFEVFEDGKLQQIATFERRAPDALLTRVGGEAATGVGTREAAMPPVVVALAWDRLTPEGRALANKAAQSFVCDAPEPTSWSACSSSIRR